MKIAILTCGILPIPAVQGGAVENLIDFYLEYNNEKKLHTITIYSPWDSKVKTHPALSSDVNHYFFIDVSSFKARIARRLYGVLHHGEYYNHYIEFYFEKIYTHLKHNDFDLIILENCPGYAYKLSQRGYHNIILHLHNDLLHSSSQYHNIIFNSLSIILTVSDYVKSRVSSINPSSKIQTIYNGIDIQNFYPKNNSPISRQTIEFSEGDFIIAYSGRINKDKGVYELIEALLLLKDIPQIKLMILGSSFFDNTKKEDSFIRSLKDHAKSIEKKINFTGFITYNQVPDYLQLADIAVLPSMWEEPFGLTIVEAMAAGLPLITTRSGGIPEICEGVAIIIDRENVVKNLASAIRDLYEHPEKRQLMTSASIERAKLFDKKTFAANFFDSISTPTDTE